MTTACRPSGWTTLVCPTLADLTALTGRRQRRLQIWQRTIQRCVQCRRPLRRGPLDPARIVEGDRLHRSHLHPTPNLSRKAVVVREAIGDDPDSAIPRQEDRSETDRPHSTREARREVRSHPRREAVHRLPSVRTILKRIRAETQRPAHRISRSCLWQEETNLKMTKDLLASKSRTTRPSTTGTSTTTSGTSRMRRRTRTMRTRSYSTVRSSSCRPRTLLRPTPTSRRAALRRRTRLSRCRGQRKVLRTHLHRREAGHRFPR